MYGLMAANNLEQKPDLSELISTKTAWMRRVRAYITPTLLLIFFFAKYVMGLPFPVTPVLFIVSFALFYNAFFIYLESTSRELAQRSGAVFATIRVILDLSFLALLVHYTGGGKSPFVFFFLFSIIGYCIATGSLRASLLMGFWGAICYSVVLLLEAFRLIEHFPMFPGDLSYLNLRVVFLNVLVFSSVVMILVLMITYLVKLLEKKEIEALSKDAEVKKARDFLDATFNAADDLILVIDSEGILLDVNNKALDLAGLDRDKVVGRQVFETFVSKDVSEMILKDLKKKAQGEHIPPYEFVLTSRYGIDIPFETRASIIPDVGLVLIARDITKRREYQKQISDANRRLERELEEVKRLNDMIVGREEEMTRLKEQLKKLKP
jgi:PAS domain S-box-containing protein